MKKNPSDLTGRNRRALLKRVEILEKNNEIRKQEIRILRFDRDDLQKQINRIRSLMSSMK